MIAAVVLAAGASSRMGEPKALLRRPDGARYVAAIVDTALLAGCDDVVVVVGPPHGEAIRNAVVEQQPRARLAFNPAPERGMLSSIQAGIGALPLSALAALVWPVDIPFVGVATVRAIAGGPGLVIPTHDGRGGHPVRIPRERFAEVMALDPARGLKALMEAHAAEVLRLPVADRAVLVDVDTPDDYARTRA